MWLVAGQAGSKFTLFSRISTTSRTTDGEYLFGAEFFFIRYAEDLEEIRNRASVTLMREALDMFAQTAGAGGWDRRDAVQQASRAGRIHAVRSTVTLVIIFVVTCVDSKGLNYMPVEKYLALHSPIVHHRWR